MIAYVKMQLLRWRRRTLGVGLLVAAVFLPTMMAIVFLVGRGGQIQERFRPAFLSWAVLSVLPFSGLMIAIQLSGLVGEESRFRRSTVLRVGSLDGHRAVGAFALLAIVLALLHGTIGFVGPAIVGLFAGIPLASWLVPSLVTILLLSAFGPPAVMAGFLLPRTLALLTVSIGALVAGVSLTARFLWEPKGPVEPGPLLGVLVVYAVFLSAGGLVWRARSSASW